MPAVSGGYGNAGAGFDNMDRSELSIPYLNLLQPMSPQLQELEDAKAGEILNTLTEETTKNLLIVPIHREHHFVEYAPRSAGGGVIARRSANDPAVQQLRAEQGRFGKLTTREGNELIETFYLYVGILDEPEDQFFSGMAIIPFTSTKIKVYQKMMTRLRSSRVEVEPGVFETPPLYANLLLLGTAQEKNKHGTFFNYKITPALGDVRSSLIAPDSPLIEEAEKLVKSVTITVTEPAASTEEPF